MRVLRPAKYIIRRLKREHRRRDVGLDKRDCARIAQQLHKRTVICHGFARHSRVPYSRIIPLDGERVLEGHGHARERAGPVGVAPPAQDLGEAVGLGVCLKRAFGVCGEDVGRVERRGLDARDDGGDRAREDVPVLGRQGLAVRLGEGRDPLCARALFVVAARDVVVQRGQLKIS